MCSLPPTNIYMVSGSVVNVVRSAFLDISDVSTFTEILHLRTVWRYLYLSISIFCDSMLLPLHYIVPSTPPVHSISYTLRLLLS